MAEPELPTPARAGIHVRRYFKFYAMGTAFLVLTAFVPPVERVVPPAFTSRPGGERPASEVAVPGAVETPSSVDPSAPALARASTGSPPPSPAPPDPGGDTTFDPPPPSSPPSPPDGEGEAPDEEECTVPGGSQAVGAARDLNSLVKGGGGPALDPVEDGVTAAAGCEADPDAVAAGAAWSALAAGRALP